MILLEAVRVRKEKINFFASLWMVDKFVDSAGRGKRKIHYFDSSKNRHDFVWCGGYFIKGAWFG